MLWLQNLTAMHDYWTGNLAAIILAAVLLAANHGRSKGNLVGHRMLQHLIWNIALYAFLEILSVIPEGLPGTGITVLLYILNSLLFVENMNFGFSWVMFIAVYLNYPIKKRVYFVLGGIMLCGLGLLVANIFTPLVFRITDNVYAGDGPLYSVYLLIAAIYLLYSLGMYMTSLRKGGALKYFPVWAYVVPVVLGMILEPLTGNSMLSICNAIGLCAVLATRQREDIFIDRLTGLYNRAYLEELKERLARARSPYVSGIMLDLNGFKTINDRFGHSEGDTALRITADILRTSAGSFGDVIRYAGDEFVIILNTWNQDTQMDCRRRIEEGFAAFNERGEKPYRLSASMGFANFNADTQSVNEFMNTIDKNMYDNKRQYYAEHERRKCRDTQPDE